MIIPLTSLDYCCISEILLVVWVAAWHQRPRLAPGHSHYLNLGFFWGRGGEEAVKERLDGGLPPRPSTPPPPRPCLTLVNFFPHTELSIFYSNIMELNFCGKKVGQIRECPHPPLRHLVAQDANIQGWENWLCIQRHCQWAIDSMITLLRNSECISEGKIIM